VWEVCAQVTFSDSGTVSVGLKQFLYVITVPRFLIIAVTQRDILASSILFTVIVDASRQVLRADARYSALVVVGNSPSPVVIILTGLPTFPARRSSIEEYRCAL